MQYFYSLITLVLQSLGQIFAVLVGWVIAVHFGRVPTRQKYILSAMGGISLLWTAMALSLTSPWVRDLLAAVRTQAVPIYVKLIIPLAGIGWILLPLVNSFLAMYLKRQYQQPIPKLGFLMGYKYTPGFAAALILMLISLPLLLLPPLLRGLRREHLTIMIKPGDFEQVLRNILGVLIKRGIKAELQAGTLWRRSPQAILALFAHDLLGDWTKHRARLIKGCDFQIIVYPTDMVIEGVPGSAIKIRNILAKELTFLEAFFTWDGAAHRLEKSINEIRKVMFSEGWTDVTAELDSSENELDSLQIPFDEWEVLYRQILQIRLEYSKRMILAVRGFDRSRKSNQLLHNGGVTVNTNMDKLRNLR